MPTSDLFYGEPDPWAQAHDPAASAPVWLSPSRPNSKQRLGVLPRTAAYLAAHFDEGDVMTLRELAANVPDHATLTGGSDGPNRDMQFQRRFRQLRDYGWVVESSQDDGTLRPDEYRLVKIGDPIWIPGRAINRNPPVPPRIAQEVFERDGHRCVLCGFGVGETHVDGRPVRLRAGHRTAGSRSGRPTVDNLRTECSLCNDAVRDERRDPVALDQLMPVIRRQGAGATVRAT